MTRRLSQFTHLDRLPYVVTADMLVWSRNPAWERLLGNRLLVKAGRVDFEAFCFGFSRANTILPGSFEIFGQSNLVADDAASFEKNLSAAFPELSDRDLASLQFYNQLMESTAPLFLKQGAKIISPEGQPVDVMQTSQSVKTRIYRGDDGELYCEITQWDYQFSMDPTGRNSMPDPVAIPGSTSTLFRLTSQGPEFVKLEASNSVLRALFFADQDVVLNDVLIRRAREEEQLVDSTNTDRPFPIPYYFDYSQTDIDQHFQDPTCGKLDKKERSAELARGGGRWEIVGIPKPIFTTKEAAIEGGTEGTRIQKTAGYIQQFIRERVPADYCSVDADRIEDWLWRNLFNPVTPYYSISGRQREAITNLPDGDLEQIEGGGIILKGHGNAACIVNFNQEDGLYIDFYGRYIPTPLNDELSIAESRREVPQAFVRVKPTFHPTILHEATYHGYFSHGFSPDLAQAIGLTPLIESLGMRQPPKIVVDAIDAAAQATKSPAELSQALRQQWAVKLRTAALAVWGNTSFPPYQGLQGTKNINSKMLALANLAYDLASVNSISDVDWQRFVSAVRDAQGSYLRFMQAHQSALPYENANSFAISVEFLADERFCYPAAAAYRAAVRDAWRQEFKTEPQVQGAIVAHVATHFVDDISLAENFIADQCQANPSVMLAFTRRTFVLDTSDFKDTCDLMGTGLYPALDEIHGLLSQYKLQWKAKNNQQRQDIVRALLNKMGPCLVDPALAPREMREVILPRIEKALGQELSYLKTVAAICAADPRLDVEAVLVQEAVLVAPAASAGPVTSSSSDAKAIWVALKARGIAWDESAATVKQHVELVSSCRRKLTEVEDAAKAYLKEVHGFDDTKIQNGFNRLDLSKRSERHDKVYTCFLILEIIEAFNKAHPEDTPNYENIEDFQAVLDTLHDVLRRNDDAQKVWQKNRLGDRLRNALGKDARLKDLPPSPKKTWRLPPRPKTSTAFSRVLGQQLRLRESAMFKAQQDAGHPLFHKNNPRSVLRNTVALTNRRLLQQFIDEAMTGIQNATMPDELKAKYAKYTDEFNPASGQPDTLISAIFDESGKGPVGMPNKDQLSKRLAYLHRVQSVRFSQVSNMSEAHSETALASIVSAAFGLFEPQNDHKKGLGDGFIQSVQQPAKRALQRAEIKRHAELRRADDYRVALMDEIVKPAFAEIDACENLEAVSPVIIRVKKAVLKRAATNQCLPTDAQHVREEMLALLEARLQIEICKRTWLPFITDDKNAPAVKRLLLESAKTAVEALIPEIAQTDAIRALQDQAIKTLAREVNAQKAALTIQTLFRAHMARNEADARRALGSNRAAWSESVVDEAGNLQKLVVPAITAILKKHRVVPSKHVALVDETLAAVSALAAAAQQVRSRASSVTTDSGTEMSDDDSGAPTPDGEGSSLSGSGHLLVQGGVFASCGAQHAAALEDDALSGIPLAQTGY